MLNVLLHRYHNYYPRHPPSLPSNRSQHSERGAHEPHGSCTIAHTGNERRGRRKWEGKKKKTRKTGKPENSLCHRGGRRFLLYAPGFIRRGGGEGNTIYHIAIPFVLKPTSIHPLVTKHIRRCAQPLWWWRQTCSLLPPPRETCSPRQG